MTTAADLKPLHNQIFFRFEEKTVTNSKGQKMFETQTDNGIVVMGNIEDSTSTPKWGTVIAVGHKTKEVVVGDRILIEPLMWTNGIKLKNDDTFWKTNEDKVIGIDKVV